MKAKKMIVTAGECQGDVLLFNPEVADKDIESSPTVWGMGPGTKIEFVGEVEIALDNYVEVDGEFISLVEFEENEEAWMQEELGNLCPGGNGYDY